MPEFTRWGFLFIFPILIYHRLPLTLFKTLIGICTAPVLTVRHFLLTVCKDLTVWTAPFGNCLFNNFPRFYQFPFFWSSTLQFSGLLAFIITVSISDSQFPKAGAREPLFAWSTLKENLCITHKPAQGCISYCGLPNQLFLYFLPVPLMLSKILYFASGYDICLVCLRVIKVSSYTCISCFCISFSKSPVNAALLLESLII